MLYVSIFRSDRARDPELWAIMWQGNAPSTLKILHVYNLMTDTRIFVWEGESIADVRYMDRLNLVGKLETSVALDQTVGWQAAFAGDLDGIRRFFEQRNMPPGQMERAIDLRRRGHEAPNLEAARRAALEWQEEQAQYR
ncbi:MAG: hypothetical protein Kow0010_11600 [Dehalococcoidia bacterium]